MSSNKWELVAAQDNIIDEYRARLLWLYEHESMMWERYRKKAESLDYGLWERDDAQIRGEAHFRAGQGLMAAWKELNEIQGENHRAQPMVSNP